MEEDFTKISHWLKQYLGAESIDSVDIMCFEDVTYIFVDAVYAQSTELYPDQLIRYSLKFQTDFNSIKILNPTKTEQWDMKTNQPVNWSSWWLDELVTRDKNIREELLLALLEYYYSE